MSRQRYNTKPLAQARDDQGLTDTEIAKRIRRHVSVVNRTLSGDPQYQSPGTVSAIAAVLRVPMADLRPKAEANVA